MVSDTGESAASINARCDDNAWPRVLLALKSGATLFRPVRFTRYFTKCQDDCDPNDGIGISATRVKKLELSGVLVRVGVDRYALGKLPEPAAHQEAEQLELL
jgi:hypothetical protein